MTSAVACASALIVGLALGGCAATDAPADRYASNDLVVDRVARGLAGNRIVARIDHARLAEAEGVPMPPSILTIAEAPALDATLMRAEPRVGLDLPLKVLVFEGVDGSTVTHPSAAFLAARHGITDRSALDAWDAAYESALRDLPRGAIDPVDDAGVTRDLGIVELRSNFGHAESIERLRAAVLAQGDTVWFGSVDLRASAASEGVTIPPATLLLFGGPKPGGVAMAAFPRLGLDAFCQKLLVLDDADGTLVLFNEIATLAILHHGGTIPPHAAIDGRLRTTFEGALQSE